MPAREVRKLMTFSDREEAIIDDARGRVPFVTWVRDAAMSVALAKCKAVSSNADLSEEENEEEDMFVEE